MFARSIFRRNLLKIGLSSGNTRNLSAISAPNDKKEEMMLHYPGFVNEIKKVTKNFGGIGNHVERVLNYNIADGKKTRAQMFIMAYEEMTPNKVVVTSDERKLLVYLAWCIEMFQGFCIILDDILDGSKTRRGKLCWYRNIPLTTAIVDGLLLKQLIPAFVRTHYGHMECYMNLLETLDEAMNSTSLGVIMEQQTEHQDVLTYTVEQYRNMAAAKAMYTTFLPIKLALDISSNTHLMCDKTRSLIYEMAYFFQIQDDFLDCYGDPDVTGKVGSDIQGGKCTWLVTSFLTRATEAQKAALKEVYGRKDEESVQCVKKLYEDVGIRGIFTEYEDKIYTNIKRDIEEAKGIPKRLCHELVDKFYNKKL